MKPCIKELILLTTVFLSALLISAGAHCFEKSNVSIHVVVNTETEISLLKKQEIKNIFMGAGPQYNLRPVALPPTHASRVIFNTMVIGLTESRIQSYWAQMRFSGRFKAPLQLETQSEVLDYVSKNPGTITYVSADTSLPDNVRVVFSL